MNACPNPLLPLLLAALVSLGVVGCGQKQPSSGLHTVRMPIGSKTFTLEIANTEETMARGLMHRDSMPADHGMIFVFDNEEPRSFWMRNTRIPLDIIYLDTGGKVVSVKSMKPYDETPVSSDGPARYAIELNMGAATEAGVKKGDVLSIPSEAKRLPG
jgi:uncharacterized protein